MPKNIKKFLKEYEAQIIVVVIILLIFNPYSRAFYKSVFLLAELIPNSKIKPLHLFTKDPILREVVYKSGNEETFADLWLPNSLGKHPAAVLNLGLDIDRKDPRVEKVARALARSGIIVLAPNIPTISERRLTRESPREFEDSLKYLASLKLADQKKIGYMTFCGASGPAFIAAQSKDLKGKVAFFVTIDPYFDLDELYKEIVSRKINEAPWTPHAKTVEIFNREAIAQLENDNDKKLLSDLLVYLTPNNLSTGKYKNVDPLQTFTTQEARATYSELTNRDPEKSDYFLNNAPEKQKEYLKELSPSAYTVNFKPKVFILSEKPSPYIPYTQAEAYRKNINGSLLEEVDFTTADINPKISFKDSTKSFLFIWGIFSFLNS